MKGLAANAGAANATSATTAIIAANFFILNATPLVFLYFADFFRSVRGMRKFPRFLSFHPEYNKKKLPPSIPARPFWLGVVAPPFRPSGFLTGLRSILTKSNCQVSQIYRPKLC